MSHFSLTALSGFQACKQEFTFLKFDHWWTIAVWRLRAILLHTITINLQFLCFKNARVVTCIFPRSALLLVLETRKCLGVQIGCLHTEYSSLCSSSRITTSFIWVSYHLEPINSHCRNDFSLHVKAVWKYVTFRKGRLKNRFFARNALWTFGGRGFCLVTFLWPLKISIFHSW